MARLSWTTSRTITRAATLLAALWLSTAAGHGGWSGGDGGLEDLPRVRLASSGADAAFFIRGDVNGLFPGARIDLQLVIENPNPRPIAVRWIAVKIHDASPACVASNLTVRNYRQRLIVPPSSSVVITRTIRMRRRAPDACQGALFPLTYSGMAVKP